MSQITMPIARWIGGLVVMFATAAVAAQGDALLVTGNNVNVRAGPSTDAGILVRVNIDEPANELRRVGQWVEVELPQQDVLGWIHSSLVAAAPAAQGRGSQEAPTVVSGQEAAAAPVDDAAGSVSGAARPTMVPKAADPVAATNVDEGRSPAVVAAVTPPNAGGTLSSQAPDSAALDLFRSDVEHFNTRALAAAGVDLFTGIEPLGAGEVRVITTDAWAIMSRPGQQSYLNALFGRWRAATGGGRNLRLEIVDPAGVLMMERSGP